MKKILFFVIVIVFNLFSCSSKSQEDSIQFNIDNSLLGDVYTVDSLNFAFTPPAGWNIDSSKPVNDQIQKFQNEELKSYLLNISEVFYDSLSNGFCSISLIQSVDSLDLNHFTFNFYSLIKKQFSLENLKQGRFSKSGMEIVQFLIMTDTHVFFKLFFQTTNKYIIQLDYAIDRSIYPNYIKKIESSIGSISTD